VGILSSRPGWPDEEENLREPAPLLQVTRRSSVSPLVLPDRLIAFARDADRAGYTGTVGAMRRVADAGRRALDAGR